MSSPSSEAAQKPHKPKQIVIHIDRKLFKVEQEELTGVELRTLPDPDIGPDFDLWLEVPGEEDRRIEDGESVKLRDGMHFFTAPRVINPGRPC